MNGLAEMTKVDRAERKPAFIRRALIAFQWFQRRGAAWVLRRVWNEIYTPKFRLTRLLRNALAGIEGGAAATFRMLFQCIPGVRKDARQTLFFFFDLQVCPVAYDIAIFLAAAELERRRRGLECVHVIIVPGHANGLKLELPEYNAVVDEDARRWRVHNLIVPAISLLPSCTGYTLCASRAHATALFLLYGRHVFPESWRPTFPVVPLTRAVRDAAQAGETIFPLLVAPESALTYVDQFISARVGHRRMVVITLRQYAYTPARNSNLADWLAFAEGLDSERYAVVFVLDTNVALAALPAGLERHHIFHAASWNIQLRMALYQRAFLNMATMHGPIELCCHNEVCRYLLFYAINTAPLTSEEHLRRDGFEIGEPLPFAKAWQRWVWRRDDLDIIRTEFYQFVPVLEAATRADDKALPETRS